MKNKFFVAVDRNSGKLLQEYRCYATYPLNMRVVLTRELHKAKQFPDEEAALKHLNTWQDYREPDFDWAIQGLEAEETDETVYPVRFRERRK